MGLLDNWEFDFGSDDTYTGTDPDLDSSYGAIEVDWDWGDSSSIDDDLSGFFGDLDDGTYNYDFSGIDSDLEGFFGDLDDGTYESGFDLSGLLGSVPSSMWNRLLDFGTGALGEWMNQKNKSQTKKSSGGGGNKKPQEAVTESIPVGTRTRR